MPVQSLELLAERVGDFDPLTVGIDSRRNFVRHNIQETARKRLEIIDASL
jgi:hypothetical protein